MTDVTSTVACIWSVWTDVALVFGYYGCWTFLVCHCSSDAASSLVHLLLTAPFQHFSHCVTLLNLLLTCVRLHVWIHYDVHTVTAQKAELLDQQHDVIQQLEEQQHSLQVMSLTCSNAID